jgi:hypothetical protein
MALKAKYRVGPVGNEGLEHIQGAGHFRALAWVLEEVANRREEEGRP